MTETTVTGIRLERPLSRPLGGVCRALARSTGTDVLLWRLLFIALAVLFHGLGVVLYLVAWVLIPAEGYERSLLESVLRGPDRHLSRREVLLLVVTGIAVVGAFDHLDEVLPLAILAGLVLLWRHTHPEGGTLAAPAPVAAAAAAASSPGAPSDGPAAPPPAPVWTPPPPRQRSVLTPLTLSVASLVVGVLLLVAAAGSASVPTEVVLAAALGAVGLGLLLSAFWGRARGLVPVALLLALALGGTAGARPAIDHGIGKRDWTASASGAYRLGVGNAKLTLVAPAAGSPLEEVTAKVSVGHLEVLVPEGVRVVVDARVQTGDVRADGVDDSGRSVHRTFVFGPEGAPQVHVDARVGTGMVEVRHA